MVTLYTFVKGGQQYTVYRDDTDFSFIDFFTTFVGSGTPDSGPPIGTIVNRVCAPGTFDRYTYTTIEMAPYAEATVEHNSDFCGYVPPACDIMKKSFSKTDETNTGANDGTANLFCTTSYPPVTYYLSPPLPDPPVTNTTGYFTGLKPGTTYYINATDANSCSVHQDFTIEPFDTTKTHFKYRLKFKTIDGQVQWELRLMDMQHSYDALLYPKDVIGSEEPVLVSIGNPDEDKTTAVISKNLTITLHDDGSIFTVDEFVVPEKTWLCELYKDGVLDFRGWIIPDENQNPYSDYPFQFTLKATDGLPSLKGNKWGNGSGGKGYGTYQVQQYGLASWISMVKQCLDQLGYDYGSPILLSSLQYNGTYDSNLWLKISTWSDILYDSSGVPMDTYSALEALLIGMKLSIFQHKGSFVFVNWNDLYYLNNGLKAADFENAIYQFSSNLGTIAATGVAVDQPEVQLIGIDYPNKPVNPPQEINYDKSYNIEEDVSFNTLSLLYENPSFEIGAVQGALPPGWANHSGVCPAYCNYDPITADIGSGALDGNWELKIDGYDGTQNNYIETSPALDVDQSNKLLNVSFSWKPSNTTGDQIDGHDVGMVFSFGILFKDASSGNVYYLMNNPNVNLSETDYLGGHTGAYNPDKPGWFPLNFVYNTEGDMAGIKGSPTTDFIGWQSFSITCPAFPETQTGTIYIRFYPPVYQQYDSANWNIISPGAKQNIFEPTGIGSGKYILIDQLDITLSDASSAYNNQTGETHITTAITGIPPANVKSLTPSLFTYPNNKRVAGNIFYGIDYATGVVANLWNFQLKGADVKDRLPATIARAIARNYCRPMYKWEGDVLSNNVSFYGIFVVKFLDNKVFMPFSIENNLRSGISHVIIIEIDDSDAQNVYTYTPIYQRNARVNG